MRCGGIAALGDERAVGFGMGHSGIRRYRPESTRGSGARASRRPVLWESAVLELRRCFRRLIGTRAMGLPRRQLMSSLRLCYRLPDFRTAIGALIDEVDLRHAPMRLDISNVHRE